MEAATWQGDLAKATEDVTRLERQVSRAARGCELAIAIREALRDDPNNASLQKAELAIKQAIELVVQRQPDFTASDLKYEEASGLLSNSPSLPQNLLATLLDDGKVAKPTGKLETWALNLLNVLSGLGPGGARTYYWLKALLSLILLLVLCLYGVWLNYGAESASTFGSDGLSDYIVMLLWGVSSEIINKTLQSISFSRPGR